MDINQPLIALVIRVFAVLVVCVPTAIQVSQMKHSRDGYTVVRWILLVLLTSFIVLSIPGISYLTIRSQGLESPVLRDISTVTTNLTFLNFSLLVTMLYLYIFLREWLAEVIAKFYKGGK